MRRWHQIDELRWASQPITDYRLPITGLQTVLCESVEHVSLRQPLATGKLRSGICNRLVIE